MLLFLAATVAHALPPYDAFEPPEGTVPGALLAPDGSGLLWYEAGDPDGRTVHVRWLPEGPDVPPLDIANAERVRLKWSPPHTARALFLTDDEPRYYVLDGARWTETEPPERSTPGPGFPRAPEARIDWEKQGKHRFTAVRRNGPGEGEVTDRWELRLGPRDRPLWDVSGRLRALGTFRKGRLRYRALPGERPVRLPEYVPRPRPEGSRRDRRSRSAPVAVVGQELWSLDGRDRPYTALVATNLYTGEARTVYAHPSADVVAAATHPDTGVPDLVFAYDTLPHWVALDPALESDLAWMREAVPTPLVTVQRARGDRRWHLCGTSPEAGTSCAWIDRDERTIVPTFAVAATAGPLELPETRPVVFETSDGLELDSYLIGAGPEPRPTIIRLHGGPYARELYAHDPLRAYLASRGYAVLELNYRGSTYLGAEVLDAGHGERGRKIERDVLEAADWLVAEGIADPERIGLIGHSYGGFSTLLNLARHPERYACGVALAPQAAWSYRWLVWALPPGLRRRAPYTQLEHIDHPLLLVHGTEDDVIPVSESRHVARVLSRREAPVAYVEVSDDHSLAGEGVERMTAEVVAAFFAGCLGGAAQPLHREGWPDSAEIVTGEELLE